MKKILVALLFSGMAYAMDTMPDIDMMILKRAGIAKLEKALQKKPEFIVMHDFSGERNNEPYVFEYDPIITILGEICNLCDTTTSDALTRAIIEKIQFIEKRDGGHYPSSFQKSKTQHIPANNKLGRWTQYWHAQKKDGTNYIRYQLECTEEWPLEQALQELRNQQQ